MYVRIGPILIVSFISLLACADSHSLSAPCAPMSAQEWLGHFAQRLEKLKTLAADITFQRIDGVGLLDDKQTRRGRLIFKSSAPATKEKPHTPAMFAVHFNKLIVDKRLQTIDKHYIFDGQWMVERDNLEKIMNKWEITPAAIISGPSKPGLRPQTTPPKTSPGTTTKPADPLALGDGPFFFPVTASQNSILKRFAVELALSGKDDPPHTVHLRLTPKPNRRTEVTQLDIWYDKQTAMPLRVETLDDGPNQKIITIGRFDIDKPVDDKVFDTSAPKERGWHITAEPYRK